MYALVLNFLNFVFKKISKVSLLITAYLLLLLVLETPGCHNSSKQE